MRPTHFSGGTVTENAISPRFRRRLEYSAPELDVPRLLRPLLPGAAAPHRCGPSGTILHCEQLWVSSLFTASATKSINSESRSRTAAGCSTPTISRPTPTISSTITASEIESVLADHRLTAPKSAVGTHATVSAHRQSRTVHLAYSNQIAKATAHHGRLDEFTARADRRSFALDHDQTKHAQRWRRRHSSLALVMLRRTSTTARASSNAFPGQPYPGRLSAEHTTFDLSLGKDFGERSPLR